MKQIIPFVKDIIFEDDIKEITSIALEHNLQMENNDSIVGDFIISGNYIIDDNVQDKNDFEKDISFDITLDDKYDATKVQIDIDNFYYEMKNKNTLVVHIDVLVNNLVYSKEKTKDEENVNNIQKESNLYDKNILTERKDDNKMISQLKEDVKQKDFRDETEVMDNNDKDCNINNDITDKFTLSFLDNNDNYVTYKVHIIREDENIDTIKEKYGISDDELKKYNNLENITIGTKVIIPYQNEE